MKSKLVIIIAAVVLLLGGGGGAYYFLVLSKNGAEEAKHKDHHEEEGEEEEEEEEEGGGHGGGHGEKGPVIEPFVVNLADPGGRRYLRLNLQLELKKPEETQPTLEARMAQMRDAVLLLLSSKTTDQLLGPTGKTALREELIAELNKVLKKKKMKKPVKNLFFTEFLIQ
jgi:flagellar FliL protein